MMNALLPLLWLLALFAIWCAGGIRRLARGPQAAGGRLAWLRARWKDTLRLALGLLGLALTLALLRPALGWRSADGPFWSDGGLPALEDRLRDEMRDWAAQQRPVGVDLAAGFVTAAGSARATLGRSRLAPGGPALREACFEIGSITKTFTGLLLARMAGAGAVGLDTPLADLLPPAAALPAGHGAVTLRRLATHTAGLPRLPPGMFLHEGRFLRATIGMDPYRGYEADDLMEAFAAVRLPSDPGQRTEYSNFGFALLGWALGRAAGGGYADAVREMIVEPLGLEGIEAQPGGCRPAAGYRAMLAVGPLRLATGSQPWQLSEALAGAGGLRSTLDGMVAWLAANMLVGDTPLRAAIELAQREHFDAGDGAGVGLAWQRRPSADLGRTVVGHDGGTGGFRSFLGFTDDRRFGVVVLGNSALPVDPLGMRLLAALAR